MGKGTHTKTQTQARKEAKAMTKQDKEQLKTEFLKAWSEKMAEWCVNNTAEFAVLPDGGIVTIDKQKIKTRFCFGESGYDFEEAAKNAHTARTSAEYFIKENMKHFTNWIDELIEAKNLNSNYMLFIHSTEYYSQTPDCKLRGISLERCTDIIDAFGGSCFLSSVGGKAIEVRGCKGHIATSEEYNAIISAFKRAAEAHEKKIATYLKRFGLSNVDAWTYWRDA